MYRRLRSTLLFLVVMLHLWPGGAAAQDDAAAHQHAAPPASGTWAWTADARVFAGFNYQLRRYTDFAAWESQNWIMLAGERAVGANRLTVRSMLSLEPATIGRYVYIVNGPRIRAGGSPQLFQTGESFEGRPLYEYQHPHDMIMGLGATYRMPRRRLAYVLGADLVGSPTLGPTPFMHRRSSRNNPQVPLSHHNLDSTHITSGVLRAGVDVSGWTVETSVFKGREPDENRYDLDRPGLDSWAVRAAWRRGRWEAQISGGLLHEPEWFAPFDQKRITASLAFDGTIASRRFSSTAAWGQTREFMPDPLISDALLVEWDLEALRHLAAYGRAEIARKEVFTHVHVPGMSHPNFLSDVGALTLGAVHDLAFLGLDRLRRFGLGADITFHRMSSDIEPLYGGSRSFHAFVRWQPNAAAAEHVH